MTVSTQPAATTAAKVRMERELRFFLSSHLDFDLPAAAAEDIVNDLVDIYEDEIHNSLEGA